ncbi:PD40 domain-containing protein, partial [Edaphobacter aggregans]|uniref:PD40 domain-containing protein n=1 Tax=Edaphobacter aggregans TaxID=570835 RepID=UPI00146FE6CC
MATDSYYRGAPVWSPDGKRAAYPRAKDLKGDQVGESQVVVWSSDNRTEDTVEAVGSPFAVVFDWSP